MHVYISVLTVSAGENDLPVTLPRGHLVLKSAKASGGLETVARINSAHFHLQHNFLWLKVNKKSTMIKITYSIAPKNYTAKLILVRSTY